MTKIEFILWQSLFLLKRQDFTIYNNEGVCDKVCLIFSFGL